MKKLVLVAVVTGLIVSCARPRPVVPVAHRPFIDIAVAESGVSENEDEMEITLPAFNPLTAAGPSDQITARFRGKDRKGPKISVVDGPFKKYSDVSALMASLPTDVAMRNHTPAITPSTMTRAVEENRNVRLSAWIYAIKYESDQDWHVIIGSDPVKTPVVFFNAEVSGLPPASSSAHATLLAVRNGLASILNNELPAGSGYRKYEPPIHVRVEGSLFFDIDHVAGVVGPAGMRPATAWEVHPVTKLTLQ